MKHLEGINPAILTLFNEDYSVDYEGMEALLDFLMDAKVNGVYVCGTTGEFPLLALEERKKIAETVVNHVKGKITVYVHIGSITTGDAVALAKHAYACGADGIGALSPYYYSYSEDELFRYFSKIANSLPQDFPVYLYNIPQRTGNRIDLSLFVKLVENCPNIVGIKDSSGSLTTVMEYLLAFREKDVMIIEGADEQLLSGLSAGCKGSISGNANVFPELFTKLWKEFKENRLEEARETQLDIAKIVNVLKYGNIPLLKYALKLRGIGNGICREAFSTVSSNETVEGIINWAETIF
ncbi:dihydrodipicolinate synthase family protein [Candidatus Sordicultor fermentans]|jgi:4-hydroxy-tetrahydrodipicolinate synthase|uniref:dihydrodipicolinate synthase family protein n=1 Tax=Candidatus Sordicultor fermentans TaxID=1953203 RepID=UPI0016A3B94D|nr:dihydrodipicolinate synthase family protein [Candidatus Atribacteria bacterium]